MVDTALELMEYLDMRGAKYGISGAEILEQIPESARDPQTAYNFMQLKDISHIKPLSQGGVPAGDNWILEDSSVNRSRGAETMTNQEIAVAQADSIIDGKQLAKAALTGGALATGSAVAEGALLTAEVVSAVPVIITCAAVGGAGWLAWKAYKAITK